MNASASNSLRTYLQNQLDVSRLDAIHEYSWFAGLPQRARPLHYQRMKNHQIIVTERTDRHLLWQDNMLLVAPLPAFLLDYDIWIDHICPNRELTELANGMLLSYTWLVSSENDLMIAHEAGLLSKEIDWPRWTTFVGALIGNLIRDDMETVALNKRYHYGELRIGRINTIYRWSRETTSLTAMIRGHNYEYTTY